MALCWNRAGKYTHCKYRVLHSFWICYHVEQSNRTVSADFSVFVTFITVFFFFFFFFVKGKCYLGACLTFKYCEIQIIITIINSDIFMCINIQGLLQKQCFLSFVMLAQEVRGRRWWYGNRLNLPTCTPLHVLAMGKMTAEGQSNEMTSDMGVWMKQSCVTAFLHAVEWHSLTFINTCWMVVETKQ